MKMSKKHKLNDAEIYYDLLMLTANLEGVDVVDITETPDILSALKRLMLSSKYVMFDLDATRRERDYWKKLVEDNGKKS
jgi:hypothetical protein